MSNRDEIIAIIQECAQKLGRAPSRAEFHRASKISWHQVYRHFRGMRPAVRAAGLEPGPRGGPLDLNTLVLDWAHVVRDLQHLPSRAEYDRLGKHHSVTLHARIGWSQMAHSFVLLVREFHLEREWSDVVGIVVKKFPLLGKSAIGTWPSANSKGGLTAEDAEHAKDAKNAKNAVDAKDKQLVADARRGRPRTNSLPACTAYPLHTHGAQPGVPDARRFSRGGVEAPSAAFLPVRPRASLPDECDRSTAARHPSEISVAPASGSPTRASRDGVEALLPVFCPANLRVALTNEPSQSPTSNPRSISMERSRPRLRVFPGCA